MSTLSRTLSRSLFPSCSLSLPLPLPLPCPPPSLSRGLVAPTCRGAHQLLYLLPLLAPPACPPVSQLFGAPYPSSSLLSPLSFLLSPFSSLLSPSL